MILFSLEINPIELGNSGVRTYNLAISEEPPNLSESHGKTFL